MDVGGWKKLWDEVKKEKRIEEKTKTTGKRRNSSKISSDDTKKELKMEQDLIYGDRKSRKR